MAENTELINWLIGRHNIPLLVLMDLSKYGPEFGRGHLVIRRLTEMDLIHVLNK